MIIKSTILNQFPKLIHGYTTRELGAQYKKIADYLNVNIDSIISLKQIHSNQVIQYSDSMKGSRELNEGDALMSNHQGIIIGIRTADCVPILVYDPIKKAVAALHAGWRGLISGVIENGISHMIRSFSTKIKDLAISIGPALCEDCFEVGPEVVKSFINKFGPLLRIKNGGGDRGFIDLRKGCRLALKEIGVSNDRIEELPFCTACNNDYFFSYRNGDHEGRSFAFIGINP